MNLTTLDTLTDPDLQAVIARANGLLKQRDDKRKADALAEVERMEAELEERKRAVLEAVGLKLTGAKPKARKSVTKKGQECPKCGGTTYYSKSDDCVGCKQKAAKPKVRTEKAAPSLREKVEAAARQPVAER